MKKQRRCPRCKTLLVKVINEGGEHYVCGNYRCNYAEPK
jgi:ssDNA-binding Zn-finger/Zn-ribbon topoisomerase 1